MVQKKPFLIDDSTEALLEQFDSLEEASGEEQYEQLNKDNVVYLFVRNFNLRPGKIQIPVTKLYKIYKLTTHSPITYTKFRLGLKDYIQIDKAMAFINTNMDEVMMVVAVEKKKTETLSQRSLKKYEKFLAANNIQDGTDLYITATSLYYFFDKWTYDNKLLGMPLRRFTKLTNLYLTNTKQITTDIHYGVDKKFYDGITEEEISKAKNWSQTLKTKQRKVSSTKRKLQPKESN